MKSLIPPSYAGENKIVRDGEDINKNPPMFEIGVVSQISSIGGGLKGTIEVYHISDGNTSII